MEYKHVFLVMIFLFLLSPAYCADTVLKLDVEKPEYYFYGIPVLVKVKLINVSDSVINLVYPSQKNGSLNGEIIKEGLEGGVPSDIHNIKYRYEEIRCDLHPGETIKSVFDYSEDFHGFSIKPGKNVCEIKYRTYQDREPEYEVGSGKFIIEIIEPHSDIIKEEDLSAFIRYKRPDKNVYNESGLLELIDKYKNNDYGRYGRISLSMEYDCHKKFGKAAEQLELFLIDPPEVFDEDEIYRRLSIYYGMTSNKIMKDKYLKKMKVLSGLNN